MIEALWHALPGVLAWQNALAMLVGTVGGILVGALPGLTAAMGVAVLLPLTFTLDPLVGLGMMAGVWNGAIYGGAIPAILLRIPGTPAAICTTFDGYPMARQGRAGYALQVAAVSSAVGGMMSAIALMTLAPPLSRVTLLFGPPEMFWVGIFGLTSIAVLLGDDVVKGLISAAIGLLIAMVGIDHLTGHERFTFGNINLVSGFNIVVLLIGLYALPPAILPAEEAAVRGVDRAVLRFSGGTASVRELLGLWVTWIRASIIGIIVGILPGAGGNIAAFLSYNEEKRTSRDPASFGKGNPAGVAASECANNADNAAAMIPALTLGVPGSIVAALIMGGLLVQGMQPGPQLFRENPDVVYGFMIQMFLTSAMLFVLGGLVFARLFAQVLRVPQVVLMPMIIALTITGVYVIHNSTFDLYVVLGFGLLGYAMERLSIPLAPATLGLILGNMVFDHAVLAAPPDSPFNPLKDVVEYAKKHPKQLTVASAGIGSNTQIDLMMFEQLAGISLVHVPFEGGGASRNALLGKHVTLCASAIGDMQRFAVEGKVKILGIHAKKRLKTAPNVPTFEEQGYPLYNGSARGLVGPKGMPEEAIRVLAEGIAKGCQDPGFEEKSASMSLPLDCMGRKEYGEYLQQAYKDIGELWKRSPWRQ